jgi:hypothetical protein
MSADQQQQAPATDDKFYVTPPTSAEELTIRIIALNGVVMSSNTYLASGKNNIEVNASNLSRGIYMLQLKTEQGSQTLRFIKK